MNSTPVNHTMQELNYFGSTSGIYRFRDGVVVKMPWRISRENPNYERLQTAFDKALNVERQILEHLGPSERIVEYLGPYESSGILLAEADHGNLQKYIDEHNATIDPCIRWKWVLQITEAIVYIHQKSVFHSNLRPENILVHSERLDLRLCDFGGSVCESLGLDGGNLPDDPFFDPRRGFVTTPATDIFSLGSIIYTILTGYWPYRDSPPPPGKERRTYDEEVNKMFQEGRFPDVSKILGGEVIKGCWDYKYETAENLLNAIKKEMALEPWTKK